MPNPSELERQEQEAMRRVSGHLNEDAFAGDVLRSQIDQQEEISKGKEQEALRLHDELERIRADAATARERAESLRRSLAKLENRDGR